MVFYYSLEGFLMLILSCANLFFLIAYGNRDIKRILLFQPLVKTMHFSARLLVYSHS